MDRPEICAVNRLDKELIALSSLCSLVSWWRKPQDKFFGPENQEVGIVISSCPKGSSHYTRQATNSSKNQYGTPKLVVAWGQIHRHRSTSMGCVRCAERGVQV